MGADPNLSEVGAKIEGLLEELGSFGDRSARSKIEELVRSLMELYGSGIERIMEIVALDETSGERLLQKMVDDELIEGLLILHGLHPLSLDERIHQALDRVRPYLGSHAGGVEFLGVDDDDVVHLRLEGSCDGCPSSTVTVKFAIERAIQEAAPEVARVEVEGVAQTQAGVPGLVQIAPLGAVDANAADVLPHRKLDLDWATVGERDTFLTDKPNMIDVGGSAVIVLRSEDELYAYKDTCPGCKSSLRTAFLEGYRLTCATCHHSYDIRLAGRSTEGFSLHLDPLPLLTTDD
ncbi:MAG TPA: NifU family protein, partial [Actinomycetota bacterium]|nr:NifU family protein [Actinomycetota bacterium]